MLQIGLLLHRVRGLKQPHPRTATGLVLAVIGQFLNSNWIGFIMQTWQPWTKYQLPIEQLLSYIIIYLALKTLAEKSTHFSLTDLKVPCRKWFSHSEICSQICLYAIFDESLYKERHQWKIRKMGHTSQVCLCMFVLFARTPTHLIIFPPLFSRVVCKRESSTKPDWLP